MLQARSTQISCEHTVSPSPGRLHIFKLHSGSGFGFLLVLFYIITGNKESLRAMRIFVARRPQRRLSVSVSVCVFIINCACSVASCSKAKKVTHHLKCDYKFSAARWNIYLLFSFYSFQYLPRLRLQTLSQPTQTLWRVSLSRQTQTHTQTHHKMSESICIAYKVKHLSKVRRNSDFIKIRRRKMKEKRVEQRVGKNSFESKMRQWVS